MGSILNENDIKIIDKRIKEFELNSSAEIVCMIQNKSNDYLQTHYRASLIITLILHCGLLFLEWWHDAEHMLLSIGISFLVLLKLAEHFPALAKLFLYKDEAKIEVKESAISNFFIQGLHKTEEKNGILLYLSNYEKEIYLMADQGVFNLLKQEEWDQLNKDLATYIKRKEALKGVLNFIEEIEKLVKTQFPYKAENANELSNIIKAKY